MSGWEMAVRALAVTVIGLAVCSPIKGGDQPGLAASVDIGARLELFVDDVRPTHCTLGGSGPEPGRQALDSVKTPPSTSAR